MTVHISKERLALIPFKDDDLSSIMTNLGDQETQRLPFVPENPPRVSRDECNHHVYVFWPGFELRDPEGLRCERDLGRKRALQEAADRRKWCYICGAGAGV